MTGEIELVSGFSNETIRRRAQTQMSDNTNPVLKNGKGSVEVGDVRHHYARASFNVSTGASKKRA